MNLRRLSQWLNANLPPQAPGRKVIQILSIILVVEGISVLFLFSYVGPFFGFGSLLIGSFLLLLLRQKDEPTSAKPDSPGVRLVDYLFNLIGGDYPMMFVGATIIGVVLLYNWFLSSSPEIGDSDTLSILFGFTVMLYPLVYNRFRIEASFALIFTGMVVAILVVPRALNSLSDYGDSSAVGDWYVHYMLAAPFAGILDSIGISSSSVGNLVTIEFRDGGLHTLSISAYCAGLYSFSIFLSAFVAFALVFERYSQRLMAVVLAIGLAIAYLGNLVRMTIIGIVGFYYGLDALHWTHQNVGWVIFLSWSTLFWYVVLRYSDKLTNEAASRS